MVYADLDFFLALVKEDDWLRERAEELLDRHEGEIETSVATFIELFLVSDRYDIERDAAAAHIMEIAETDVSDDVVFQASAYMDDGLNALDAFHCAFADGPLISSDGAFDDLGVDRIPLEPEE